MPIGLNNHRQVRQTKLLGHQPQVVMSTSKLLSLGTSGLLAFLAASAVAIPNGVLNHQACGTKLSESCSRDIRDSQLELSRHAQMVNASRSQGSESISTICFRHGSSPKLS